MALMRFVEVTAGPKGGSGYKINDLKISFKIEKSIYPEPNVSTIKIYNLTQETSSKIAVAENHIQLRAGYEDETVGAILFGDVISGFRYKDGTDFITELQVQDGRSAVMGNRITASFAKNVEAATVAAEILNAIGLPHKGLDKIPDGETYPSGFAFTGMATDALRKVLNRFGLTHTIQNQMLYILREGEEAEQTGLLLTADTGLLTSPQPVSDKTAAGDIHAKAANAWKFTTMLFPQLIPAAACKIESLTFTGDMLIQKAFYEGDNWDGPFQIDIEGEAL